MPFIPHTDNDTKAMLSAIGVEHIDALFDEIPNELRIQDLKKIPHALSEMEIARLMQERADLDGGALNFIGAGAYEHHIPAAVWQLTTRGEFYSAYTPYQAEASQGTLQVIYEYQSMITSLTGLDVSNASLYDGASALAEAILMAIRINRKSKTRRILIPKTVHPTYRKTIKTICEAQKIDLQWIDYDVNTGQTDLNSLQAYDAKDVTALVIPQPNFFGVLEEMDEMTQWAKQHKAISIALVNPTSLALLEAPGEWGKAGVDIAVGEGQPLGAPLSSGGPYYGFMCCKKKHVRQMPGRIVGRTIDADGKSGFVLTLQAREQHIRRSKATSNICTNQGLVVTASTIHMSLLGPKGLQQVAASCYEKNHQLASLLKSVNKRLHFSGHTFHETVLELHQPANLVLAKMAEQGILGGYDLGQDYPELAHCILFCATETKTTGDLQRYVTVLQQSLKQLETSELEVGTC